MESKKSKKGFFFTVMALAILSFMLLTVQVWVQAFEQSDKRASERFKGEAMRSILSTLSDKALSDFANASAFYATYELVNYTSYPGNEMHSDSPTLSSVNRAVNATIYGLMQNGSSDPNRNGKGIAYSSDNVQRYTFSAWHGRISQAANIMGFNASFSDMKNFSYWQIDAWTVGVSFDVEMNVTDMEGTMRHSKMLHASTSFPINGFLDPMVARESGSGASRVERNIWKHGKYNNASDIRPKTVADGTEGIGWFFGPIAPYFIGDKMYSFNDSSIDSLSRIGQFILVRNPDDGNISLANMYGGLIVVGTRDVGAYKYNTTINGCLFNVIEDTQCVNCLRKYENTSASCTPPKDEIFNNVSVPYIAVPSAGFLSNIPNATEGYQYILFDNEFDTPDPADPGRRATSTYEEVWDINSMRDMAVCGFYVKGEGPSFFERMFGWNGVLHRGSAASDGFGIESFVIGKWAGGKDGASGRDQLSRLDWEFFSSPTVSPVSRVKGMPGCRSKDMCYKNTNVTDEGIGRFRLSYDAIERYGLDLPYPHGIYCDGSFSTNGCGK